MELGFTLNKMEELYAEAINYYEIYKNSLEEVNQIINNLSTVWRSDETYTYQEFYQKYKEKYPKLLEVRDMMAKFCHQIEEKRNEFIGAATNAINSFE